MSTNENDSKSTGDADFCAESRTMSGQGGMPLCPKCETNKAMTLDPTRMIHTCGLCGTSWAWNYLTGWNDGFRRATPPASASVEEKPTYCCERCGRQAHELEDGNWLSRINPGEIPSRWRCQAHIETGPPVSHPPAERPTPTIPQPKPAGLGRNADLSPRERPTPITDAMASMRRTTTEWKEHAEKLERQLAEAREERDSLADCLDHLRHKDWFREGVTGREVVCGLDPDKVRSALAAVKGGQS